MFATDYLKGYAGAEDWVCVVDAGCGYSSLLCHGFDYSAWWSPSRKLVAFGNNWFDVTDMPSAAEPTEEAVYAWVAANPGYLQRKINAAVARNKVREAEAERTDKFYAEFGVGEVHVELRAPDGSVKEFNQACGIYGPLCMMRLVIDWMRREMPPESVLQRLIVYRNKAAHRGEKPLSSRDRHSRGVCETPS